MQMSRKAFFTQWVLREAYIKWTGEDFREIFEPSRWMKALYTFRSWEDYSGAIWSQDPLELRWEHVDVQLP